MRAPILLTLILVATLSFSAACNGGDDGPSEEELQQGLQLMVLQEATIIPLGLQGLGGSFADNDQAASGLGGGPTKDQLETWGRILGYGSDYQRGESTPETSTTALGTNVSLYEDAAGAAASFTDRVARARNADWQGSHSDLTDFQQEELTPDLPVDDSYWIHLTGYQATSSTERRLVADDIVIFRVGRAWGYLNVVSTAAAGAGERDFANNTVENLVLKQIENTRNGLDSGLLD